MNRKIYHLANEEKLHALRERTFDSEDTLQGLIATHPKLLAGDQMNENAPRRWLLVSSEHGIADAEDAGSRWNVDHLFLDQDGIPTFVEVKRSADRRTRRKVVGQMMDYVSHAAIHTSVDKLRSRLGATHGSASEALANLLETNPEDAAEREVFWRKVKTNLEAERIRLVFVADRLPSELRRIIEFLNGQMDPAEVLGVEVRRFAGDDLKTLVPTVVGQTAEAQQKKQSSVSWSEGNFFEELGKRSDKDVVETAERIYKWGKKRDLDVEWRSGDALGGFFLVWAGDEETYLFKITIGGKIWTQSSYYSEAFEDNWQSLGRRMENIGLEFPADPDDNRHPQMKLHKLRTHGLDKVEETFDWVVDHLNDSREK